ncbi:MAG: tRNA (guanosine(46)-N7)-methyltransferase TrmB [Gammaproteobacteria bacterium]|jgi:tRNA (guanine-N7-)-methyltransferase|nr:tRNA (guanosine(46)-N7)-methyltransferase TrmB [Gammaproteobacteria bacterium]MBT7603659.1 tRNA (guanosine(46)-N7)-methyltransferase TrmB [Gammaproteobacteria bacterium]
MKFVSHIKSYVKRNGRITTSQKKFLKKKEYDNNFFIISKKNLNYKELFNNSNPCVLDIGFGDGKLLISIAKKFPEINFIGLEVYESGIGNILCQIDENKINNIKISNLDAVEALNNHINDKSLFGISLFFPDPWPKKKHHKRRIINDQFIKLISTKVKKNGFIKITTDWSNYADIIIKLFDHNNNFKKAHEIYLYKNRDITKFEKRGILLGNKITELSYFLN